MKKIFSILLLFISLNSFSNTNTVTPCTGTTCLQFNQSDFRQIYGILSQYITNMTVTAVSSTITPCTGSTCVTFNNSDLRQIYGLLAQYLPAMATSSTFTNYWSVNGNTVTAGLLGTKTAQDFALITNNLRRAIFGSNGTNTWYADSATFEIPLIVDGGRTVNSANPYMQLKGYYIGGYRIKNTSTNYEWFMQNQTIAGSTLDNFSIGTSSNPDNGFIKVSKRGKITVQSYLSNVLREKLTIDTTGAVSFSGAVTTTGSITDGGRLIINNLTDDVKIDFRRTGGDNWTIQHDASRIYFYNQTAVVYGMATLDDGKTGFGGQFNPAYMVDITGDCRATTGFNSNGVNNFSQINGFTNSLSLFSKLSTGVINLGVNAGTTVFEVNSGGCKLTGTNGTVSIGNTNTLTAGNAGTLSVLTDNRFQITFICVAGTNPADATTYYLTTVPANNYYTFSSTLGRYRLPDNCTLTNWTISNFNFTSNGSGESTTFAVRKNDATDDIISSNFTYTGALDQSGSGSINYAAGDLINMKITTPTWVTNPQGVVTTVTLWFTKR